MKLSFETIPATLLALAVSLGGLAGCALTDGLPAGTPAPELAVTSWVNAGATAPTVAGNRGKHLLIEFWSIHCPHCRDRIPEMREITARYCCTDLEVLSVHVPLGDHDDTPAEIAAFAEKEQLPYPVGVDPTGATLHHFQFGYLPHGCLIGPDGRVVWAGSMSTYDTEDQIRQALGGGDAGTVGVVSTLELSHAFAECDAPDCEHALE